MINKVRIIGTSQTLSSQFYLSFLRNFTVLSPVQHWNHCTVVLVEINIHLSCFAQWMAFRHMHKLKVIYCFGF
jgi:hypothetical protein